MEKDRIKRRRRAEWRNKAPEKGRIGGRHIAAEKMKLMRETVEKEGQKGS